MILQCKVFIVLFTCSRAEFHIEEPNNEAIEDPIDEPIDECEYFVKFWMIQGDLDCWFGYDFFFSEVEDENGRKVDRAVIGAPLKINTNKSRGQIFIYDDSPRWSQTTEINSEYFRQIQVLKNRNWEQINVVPNFIGSVLHPNRSPDKDPKQLGLYACDPLLQFNMYCNKHDEDCATNYHNNTNIYNLQYGGCFFFNSTEDVESFNLKKAKTIKFWNPVIKMHTIDDLVIRQRSELLENRTSAASHEILFAQDRGGLDGLAQFGSNLLIDTHLDQLISTGPGVGFGQGQIISSKKNFTRSPATDSIEGMSALDHKPDKLVDTKRRYENRMFGEKILFVIVNNEKLIVVGEPKGLNENEISTGVVIMYKSHKTDPHLFDKLEVQNIIFGETFNEHFGFEIIVCDFDHDGMEDLIIASPFWTTPTCLDCGKIYYYRQDKRGYFILFGALEGTEPFGRFGHSMIMQDVDGNGSDDLIVSAPFSPKSIIYVILSRPNREAGFCPEANPILTNAKGSLFGLKMRFYKDSLYISIPKQSGIAMYTRKKGYVYNVLIEKTDYSLDLRENECPYDDKVVGPCVQITICAELYALSADVFGAQSLVLNIDTDDRHLLIKNKKLFFGFERKGEKLCVDTITHVEYRYLNLTTATVYVKGGEYDKSDEVAIVEPIYIGCINAIPKIQLYFEPKFSANNMLPNLVIIPANSPNRASFFINVTTNQQPIVGAVLLLSTENGESIIISSKLFRKWNRVSTFESRLDFDQVLLSEFEDEIQFILPEASYVTQNATILLTLTSLNFPEIKTIAKLPFEPKLKIRENLLLTHDNIILNETAKTNTTRVKFETNLNTRSSFDILIETPSCCYDFANNKWIRFIDLIPPDVPFLTCHSSPFNEANNVNPHTSPNSKLPRPFSCNTEFIKCDIMNCRSPKKVSEKEINPTFEFDIMFKFVESCFPKTLFFDNNINYRMSTELTGSRTGYASIQVHGVFREKTIPDLLKTLPSWALILPVALGILIILLLSYYLWRMGCFEKQDFQLTEPETLPIMEPSESIPHIKVDPDFNTKKFLEHYLHNPSPKKEKSKKGTEV